MKRFWMDKRVKEWLPGTWRMKSKLLRIIVCEAHPSDILPIHEHTQPLSVSTSMRSRVHPLPGILFSCLRLSTVTPIPNSGPSGTFLGTHQPPSPPPMSTLRGTLSSLFLLPEPKWVKYFSTHSGRPVPREKRWRRQKCSRYPKYFYKHKHIVIDVHSFLNWQTIWNNSCIQTV